MPFTEYAAQIWAGPAEAGKPVEILGGKEEETGMIVTEPPSIAENPREAYNETIREVFVHILSCRQHPLSARLFSMAGFAFEADSFIYPWSPDFSEDRLAQEIDKVADRVYEELWLSEMADSSPDLELAMSMVQTLLLGRVGKCRPAFREMILSAWAQFRPDEQGGANLFEVNRSEKSARLRCARMAETYRERRDRLYAALGGSIEEHLTDFCLRFLANRSLMEAPGLLAYAQEMMLHVMVVKFFLASNPDLLAASPEETEEPSQSCGSALIGRVEHHLYREAESMARLRDELTAQGMQDLSHTGLLILF